jgi:cysteine desulfurase
VISHRIGFPDSPIHDCLPPMTVYLDNAASTPPAPEVVDALARAMTELYANPSSAHGLGAAAARALEQARAEVAMLLRAQPAEIAFTSGGTEANALGLLGAAAVARGRHLVVSAIEHPAVLRSAETLVKQGWEITKVAPEPDGRVTAEAVRACLRPETAILAVMLVNNELGTLQPVAEISRAARAINRRIHFHVDAVQAAGLLAIDVASLGVDSLALSGHKLHGPKGTGALWLRKGARVAPLWDGGRQEAGLRSGTENLPGWVGLGRAAVLCRERPQAGTQVAALRDQLESLVLKSIPRARPTVPAGTPRAPHITSLLFANLPAEPLLHALEAHGVYASAGSACSTRSHGPSHVLEAIGVRDQDAVLRFSLSRLTTLQDVEKAAAALRQAVDEIAAVVDGGQRP